MSDTQASSVSKIPTMCEVRQILIDLLKTNNVGTVGLRDTEYYANCQIAKTLSLWMCYPQRTPEEIYELIGPEFEKLQNGSENKLAQAFLAAVLHDALGVIYVRQKIVLTGHWAKIARCMIKYFYENERSGDVCYYVDIRNYNEMEATWLLNACNADICPDHTLRLEIFGFIWFTKYLKERTTEQMVDFFIGTISELDFDDIYNSHAHDLCFSTENLCACFDRLDEKSFSLFCFDREPSIKELTDVGQKITESLLDHECSSEVKFLQNILKLTGILAQIARFQFQSKSRLLRKWLNDCLTLFIHKYRKFFKDGMEKFAIICLHPFIYPYYIGLVDNVTNSILDLSGKLNKWRKNKKLTRCRQNKFRRLETRRNYMVFCVGSMSSPVNLPPLLLKQELGILNPTGRAELQRKVFNQPCLPLSFKYSDDGVDFSEYNDQLIDYDFLNLYNANNDGESDDDDDLWETDNNENESSDNSNNDGESDDDDDLWETDNENYDSNENSDNENNDGESDDDDDLWETDNDDNYDSNESSDNGNFVNVPTLHLFLHNAFGSITNEDESSGRTRLTEYENASDDTTDSNASDTDDSSGETLSDIMRRLNVL